MALGIFLIGDFRWVFRCYRINGKWSFKMYQSAYGSDRRTEKSERCNREGYSRKGMTN